MFDLRWRDVFGKGIKEGRSLSLRDRLMALWKQPAPRRFESSQIPTIDDQAAVDLFVGRYLRMDVDVGQAKRFRNKRHKITGRCLPKSFDDGVPLRQELGERMVTARTLPTPGGGELSKVATFNLKHKHSTDRSENYK